MAVVDEFITLLSLEEDPRNSKVAGNMKGALGGIAKAAAIAGAAFSALKGATLLWVNSVADSVDAGGKFADSIGMAYETLQELEFAAQRSGGSIQGLRTGIAGFLRLAKNESGKTSTAFKAFGIQMQDAQGKARPLIDVLGDVAAQMEGMEKSDAFQLGRKIGLNKDTIMMLQNGKEGLAKLRQEARDLGAIIPEDAKYSAAEYNDAVHNIMAAWKGLSEYVIVKVMPTLTENINLFKDWIIQNRELIQTKLQDFLEGLVRALRGVTRGVKYFASILRGVGSVISALIPDLSKFGAQLDDAEGIAIAVAAALSVLTVALGVKAVVAIVAATKAFVAFGIAAWTAASGVIVATWPFLALGAAIAAVVLIVQDLYTYFTGGKSVTGAMVKALKGPVVRAWKSTVDAISGAYEAVKSFFNTYVVSPVEKYLIGPFKDAWAKVSEWSAKAKQAVADFYDAKISPAIEQYLTGPLGQAWDSVKSGADAAVKAVSDFYNSQISPVIEHYLTGPFQDAWKSVSDWASDAYQAVSGFFDGFTWSDLIPDINWNNLVPDFNWSDWLSLDGLKKLGSDILDELKTLFSYTPMGFAINWAQNLDVEKLKGAIQEGLEWLGKLFDYVIPDIDIQWSELIPAVAWSDFIPDINWDGIISIDKLKDIFAGAFSFVKDTWNDIVGVFGFGDKEPLEPDVTNKPAGVTDDLSILPSLGSAWRDVSSAVDAAKNSIGDFYNTNVKGSLSIDWEGISSLSGEAFESVQGFVQRVKWSDFIPDIQWSDFIPSLDWKAWLSALDWSNWISGLNWDIWASSFSWSDWINRLDWRDWLSDFSWRDWVPDLAWSDFLPVVNWADKLTAVNFKDFIPDLNWSDWISKLSWVEFLPAIDWSEALQIDVMKRLFFDAFRWVEDKWSSLVNLLGFEIDANASVSASTPDFSSMQYAPDLNDNQLQPVFAPSVKDALEGLLQFHMDAQAGQSPLSQLAPAPIQNTTISNVTHNNMQGGPVTVNIKESSNPKVTARHVLDKLKKTGATQQVVNPGLNSSVVG